MSSLDTGLLVLDSVSAVLGQSPLVIPTLPILSYWVPPPTPLIFDF